MDDTAKRGGYYFGTFYRHPNPNPNPNPNIAVS